MAQKDKYLFDSNVLIAILRGNHDLAMRVADVPQRLSYISEITSIELLYGAYHSRRSEEELPKVRAMLNNFNVLPLIGAEEIFCKEKERLRLLGTPIDDYDLMIAATAIANNMTLVTDNTKHFARVEGLAVENWQRK